MTFVKGLIALYVVATLWELFSALGDFTDVLSELFSTVVLIAFIYGVGAVLVWAGL